MHTTKSDFPVPAIFKEFSVEVFQIHDDVKVKVADVRIGEHKNLEEALEKAMFLTSSSGNRDWLENADVTAVPSWSVPIRSTQAGDSISIRGEEFLVTEYGFERKNEVKEGILSLLDSRLESSYDENIVKFTTKFPFTENKDTQHQIIVAMNLDDGYISASYGCNDDSIDPYEDNMGVDSKVKAFPDIELESMDLTYKNGKVEVKGEDKEGNERFFYLVIKNDKIIYMDSKSPMENIENLFFFHRPPMTTKDDFLSLSDNYDFPDKMSDPFQKKDLPPAVEIKSMLNEDVAENLNSESTIKKTS